MRKVILAAVMVFLVAASAFAADEDYEKAVAYLRAGRAAEAERLLAPLSARKPEDPYVQYHLGLARYKNGELNQALESFIEVERLKGSAGEKEFNLCSAFLNLGISAYRKKDFNLALKAAAEAEKADPDDGDVRYYMGLILIEKSQFAKALEELSLAERIKKDDDKGVAAVYDADGLAYYKQDLSVEAQGEFKKALERDSGNIEALYYLGLINYKENGYAAASPYFDRIIAAGGKDPKTKDALFNTFFNMGVDFQNRDKSNSASEMFEKALALKPDDADAHFYRGYNLAALEKYADAVDEFRKALELKPDMARAKAQLEVAGKFASEEALKEARELIGRGEYYNSLKLYLKAQGYDASNADAKRGMAEARRLLDAQTQKRVAAIKSLLEKEEYAKAKDELTALNKLNPDSVEAVRLARELDERSAQAISGLFAKAKSAEGSEALANAEDLYFKILRIDPADSRAAEGQKRVRARIDDEWSRAKAALAGGNLPSAKKHYEKLVLYTPDDPEVKRALDEVSARVDAEFAKSFGSANDFYDSGEYQKAREGLDRAAEFYPERPEVSGLKKKVIAKIQEQNEAARAAARAAQEKEKEQAVDRQQAADRQTAPPALSSAEEESLRRLYLEGVEHYTKGELREAIISWRGVLKIDPKNEKALTSLKRAEEKLKEAAARPAQ